MLYNPTIAIKIDINTIRPDPLPKGQKPVIIEARTLEPGQKITLRDFTRRKAATLIGTEEGGCFGMVDQRHLPNSAPRLVDVGPEKPMDQFQIYVQHPGRYKVVTLTYQTTPPSGQTPGT